MKRRLKRFLINAPGFLALCRWLTRHHVRTLMYHRFIGRDRLGRRHDSPEGVARQMEYIERHHRVVSSRDHLEAIRERRRLGGCPVVLTVDDGYRDFYDVLFPLLKKRGWPATFFATTGLLDRTTWFWWDKIAHLIDRAQPRRATRRVGDFDVEFDLNTPEGRLQAWSDVSDVMRWLSPQRGAEVVADLSAFLEVDLPATAPDYYAGITWDQAREMQEAGVLFGGHTVTHPILARLTPEQARWEITESRRRLGEQLGEEPAFFCYTQGGPADFNADIEQMVRDAGFEVCYLAYQNVDLSTRLLSLPRYSPSFDWEEFKWVMSGAEYLNLKLLKLFGHEVRPPDWYWKGQNEEQARSARDFTATPTDP